ncbi:MAG: sigma-70 family RNA polymerase sigma factor [Fulvivirga sp.]|uniref:RNA polymerase sigma factor n=1 Tax=Fulvivirga sp. TaxID=1931237 RepID=UPI0032EE29CB
MFTFYVVYYISVNQDELNHLRAEMLGGNNSGLSKIFESCAEYCIRGLMKKTNITKEDAEDILIESVMNFREKLIDKRLSYITNIKAYIFKTCYNMYLARIETEKRWRRKMSDIERFYYDTDMSDKGDFDHERMNATKHAWSQLSEKCRDIISYFYIDKLSMTEIAELLNLGNADVAKTSKSRCYKKFVIEAKSYLNIQK